MPILIILSNQMIQEQFFRELSGVNLDFLKTCFDRKHSLQTAFSNCVYEKEILSLLFQHILDLTHSFPSADFKVGAMLFRREESRL